MVASILGSSMAFIDGTAVNVALPALQSSLKASLTDVQWVVESYTLFLGALLLTGGSLGDIFGQRRIFMAGVVLFAAASVWSGISPTVGQLILARGLQGVGGALLVPTSLALLSVSFSRKELGKAIGTWSGVTSITSSVGPLLGGWLAQHASWRWVFAINIPVALAVLGVCLWKIPSAPVGRERPKIDWLGAALTTVGLGGVVYGFLQSSLPAGLGGVACLIGFIFAEWREKEPMLPLSLFKSRDFTGTGLLTLFLYGALSGALFFFPLNLVEVQHYSETAAGAALLPLILLIALLSRWSASLLDRFSARFLLVVGPCVAAVGFALFTVPKIGGAYWSTFLPAVVVLGLGMAITVAPLTTTVMNSVDKGRTGIASGVNNAVSRVAGLLSIALFGLLLSAIFNARMNYRLDAMHIVPERRAEVDRQRAKLAPADLHGPEQEAVQESFIDGFRAVMWLAAALSLLGAASSAAFVRAGTETKAHE